MLAPVPPERIVSALTPFDIGLVIDRPETDNARLALPNKLFEYMMAGLAVVVPPSGRGPARRDRGGRADIRAGRLGAVLTELAADRPRPRTCGHAPGELALERYNAEAQTPVLYEAWGL